MIFFFQQWLGVFIVSWWCLNSIANAFVSFFPKSLVNINWKPLGFIYCGSHEHSQLSGGPPTAKNISFCCNLLFWERVSVSLCRVDLNSLCFPRLALNLRSPCPYFLNTRIIYACYHTWLLFVLNLNLKFWN